MIFYLEKCTYILNLHTSPAQIARDIVYEGKPKLEERININSIFFAIEPESTLQRRSILQEIRSEYFAVWGFICGRTRIWASPSRHCQLREGRTTKGRSWRNSLTPSKKIKFPPVPHAFPAS